MKNKILILIAVLTVMFNSCSDDFLETSAVMSESSSSYYSNDQQIFNGLMSCYDVLQWSGGVNGGLYTMSVWIPFSEIRSDNANTGGGTVSDNIYSQQSEDFENNQEGTTGLAIWGWDYKGINRCNIIINADYVQNEPSDDVKTYVAEAKFLRAYYYFDLLRTFGPVPVFTENILPGDNYDFKRNTRDEVNAQIISDLQDAIKDLHDGAWLDQNVGRANVNAARALLGKVYLYKADWDSDDVATFDLAKEQLLKVYESGEYSLVTDYKSLFYTNNSNYNGENGPEAVFEIQHNCTSGLGNWGDTNASEGNPWLRWLGARGMSGSDEYYMGYGFMLPTQESVSYFTADDTVREDTYCITEDEMKATGESVVWEPEKAYNSEDWYGYISGKYAPRSNYDIVGNQTFNLTENERVIRYSDVILMLAETYLRGTKDESKAINLLNELRKNHLGAGTDNYVTVEQLKSTYPTRFKTTLDVVWYERRAEFAGEGDRWYDLVRTGRAPRVFGAGPVAGVSHEDDWDASDWDAMDIYMPLNTTEITAINSENITAYPDDSDREGLYPGVIDNTLESCRIESLPSKE